jgi:ribonuclease HI|tara:strand:- start:1104 stop:1541 length:438 start_codon:yes stop_codon:yes gene_type:complete
MIKIYTDGACSGNPGPGGWGFVIIDGENTKSFSGSEDATTNNRMELTAAIKAIESVDINESIMLHTDSTYVQKGITEWIINWKKKNWITSTKKPVANKDLWLKLDEYNVSRDIKWTWVKAHQSGDSNDSIYNNMADKLATGAIAK